MFMLTRAESEALVAGIGRANVIGERREAGQECLDMLSDKLPDSPYILASNLVNELLPFDWALCWVTEWSSFPSHADWNLYYLARRGWGDARELHAAPGHKCFAFEKGNLISLVNIMVNNKWGGFVLPWPSERFLFLSHDGWFRLSGIDIPLARAKFLQAGLKEISTRP